jgi:undecaprenyl phosphate-alpha-L-ara4N flippase subunit ArnE
VKSLLLLLVIISEICTVAGQLFIKHAAVGDHGTRGQHIRAFAPAIACMAAGFFIWTGVMRFMDLSELYPLEGVSRLMLVTGAVLFLKEKMTPKLWIGVMLICVGVVFVVSSDPELRQHQSEPAKSSAEQPGSAPAPARGR